MKLTEEQRKLIEENHDLIYGFLKMNELDRDEYYDIAAIALCKAAMSYDKSKGEFSTFAYLCMGGKVKHQWSYNTRKRRVPKGLIYSYNIPCNKENQEEYNIDTRDIMWNENSRDTADIFIEEEKISKFLSLLKKDEQSIVRYLVSGFNQREMANKLDTSQQMVNQKVKNIRKKWKEYNEKGYITEIKRGRKPRK